MSFLKGLDISASALTAQRLRMDVIAENLANVDTTRTAEGGAYRRRYVVMQENKQNNFGAYMERA
ncbi:MAG: flagellar basal body protein, partial [Eubacteriales bacterium]|nr:flagellar basal body protein [Eubacteriales bacterium]